MSKKAKPGKPRGRPPGSRNVATIFHDLANRRVNLKDAAGPRTATYLEAIILRLLLKAARGDLRADKRLDLIRARMTPAASEPAALLVVPGMMDQAEWIREAEIRNRFAVCPEMDPPPPRRATVPSPPVEPPRRVTASIPRQAPPRLIR